MPIFKVRGSGSTGLDTYGLPTNRLTVGAMHLSSRSMVALLGCRPSYSWAVSLGLMSCSVRGKQGCLGPVAGASCRRQPKSRPGLGQQQQQERQPLCTSRTHGLQLTAAKHSKWTHLAACQVADAAPHSQLLVFAVCCRHAHALQAGRRWQAGSRQAGEGSWPGQGA